MANQNYTNHSHGSGGRNSRYARKKKRLSSQGTSCIVMIVIFTLIAVLDVANHLSLAGASEVPSVDGTAFDSSDFDFSDFDSSDFDFSDFDSENFDFSDFEGGDMPFAGSSYSEDADSDSTVVTGSTQRVVANIRSAVNSVWITILVVCILGDAAAVTVLVLGIRKEKQAELERINAIRAKRGLPPLENRKETDGLTASQRKRLKSRRVWRVALALLLIVVITVAAFPSLYNSGMQTATLVMVEETLAGTAAIGTIDTALSGSGTLTAEDAVEQTVPSTVTVDEYYVENGDTVEEGDLIATVNLTSVQLAIRELQEDLDALDADLAGEEETAYETLLAATASGRVKVIYAEEGTSVIDTMYDNGALMLISVDGLMQAKVSALDDTAIGDSVTVTLSDGTEVTGRVADMEDDVATITLSDEETDYGDEVTVTDEDGNEMGSDTLTIHSELRVTNYYGTVESISVSVDDEVAAGDELLVLTDVGTTAEYQSLLEQREDLEEQMTELAALMQDNHIYAENTGIVSGISDDAVIVTASVDEEDDSEDSDENSEEDEGDDTAAGSGSAEGTVSMIDDTTEKINTTSGKSGGISATSLTLTYDFSKLTGNTDSALALTSAMTGIDMMEGAESSYSESDDSDILAGFEGADSTGTETTDSDTVEESLSSYSVSTTVVLSITPTDTMTISISIDELDILSVETGQSAEITLDALSGQSFTGTVTRIDETGTNSGGSTKYTAEITLERTSDMLDGMNATARIILEETENILVIPVAAICEEGNKSYVYTMYDEESDMLGGLVEVETGVSDGTNVEITSGLAEGDTYYYVYTENITYSVESGGNFFANLFGGLF